MLTQNEIELIHREIDGLNSAKDHKRLETLLRENEEARKLLGDLRTITRALDSVPEPQPSPNLKKRVMNLLPRETPAWGRQRRWEGIFSRLHVRDFKLAHVTLFAAGVVTGIAFFLLINPAMRSHLPGDAQNALTGTSVLQPTPSGEFETMDHRVIANAQVRGELSLQKARDRLRVALHVSHAGPLTWRLSWDAERLSFRGIDGELEGQFDVGRDDFIWRTAGEKVVVLSFLRLSSSAPIEVTYQALHADSLLVGGILSANRD